jgi:putative peptidoglycan lipid II flippase
VPAGSAGKGILRNAGVVGIGTLASRIAGLARDQVTAYCFGAGPAADAFFVAFRIPNLLRRLLAEGALTPAFVPVFTERLVSGGTGSAGELFRGVFTLMAGALAAVTVLGVVFAPEIVRLIAPGFGEIPGQLELTVLLARILFPYILLMALTALAMGVLNSLGRFNIPALGPVMLNICMILGAAVLSPRMDTPVLGLAIGALAGGVAQLAIQLPGIVRAGVALGFANPFRDPEVRRVFALMAPMALGAAAYQISVFVNTQLASFLREGSVSWLYYADRLVQFPLGVFSLALATAVLPAMSRVAAVGDRTAFRAIFRRSLAFQFFITLPAAAGLAVMSVPLTSVLFERGSFDAESTLMSARALAAYAAGLPFISGASLAARAFYSMKNTRTPAKVAALSVAAGLAASLVLMGPFGHVGLALASSFASLVNFIWLAALLRRSGDLEIGPFVLDTLKSTAMALAMAAALWPLYGGGLFPEAPTALLVAAGLFAGPALYFLMAHLAGSEGFGPLKEIAVGLAGRFAGRRGKDAGKKTGAREAGTDKASAERSGNPDAGAGSAEGAGNPRTGAGNRETQEARGAAGNETSGAPGAAGPESGALPDGKWIPPGKSGDR